MSSLYEVLGVEKGASVDEIRRSYKDLARQTHPDRGGDAEKFKKIQQAHEVLSDEGKRRMYDMTGSVDGNGGGGMDEATGGMAAGGIPFEFMRGMGPFGMPGVSFDFGSMFNGMFGGGGGPQGGRGGPRAGKGPNKHSDIGLTLADFYKGRELKLKFNQSRRCEGCGGVGAEKSESCGPCSGRGIRMVTQMLGPGMIAQSQVRCDVCSGEGKRVLKACTECHGRKFKEREKELTVQIKPGMHDGQTLTFAGECSDTTEFEAPGDVVLTLKRVDGASAGPEGPEGPEGKWEWKGVDLWVRLRIPFAESVLGFHATIEGHPSGTPLRVEWYGGPLVHGSVLQAAAKGMPDGQAYGVCYIQVLVSPPEARAWTAEECEKLRGIFGLPAPTEQGAADVVQLTPHSLESKTAPI